jgi:hypothetical protein
MLTANEKDLYGSHDSQGCRMSLQVLARNQKQSIICFTVGLTESFAPNMQIRSNQNQPITHGFSQIFFP